MSGYWTRDILFIRHLERSVVERSHTFALAKVNVSKIHRYEIFILNGALENLHSSYI